MSGEKEPQSSQVDMSQESEETYLGLSIFNLICFLPLAIPAIVCSCKAQTANDKAASQTDPQTDFKAAAQKAARDAWKLNMAALVCGTVTVFILGAIYIAFIRPSKP